MPLPERFLDELAARVAERLPERTAASGYMGVERAAAFLDCPTSRIYALTSAGRLPCHRDGSRLLFDAAELRTWVERGGAKRP